MHREVGVGIVVTSGSLCDLMVSTLAGNVIDVGSIPALGTIFLIFITHNTGALTRILYKLGIV